MIDSYKVRIFENCDLGYGLLECIFYQKTAKRGSLDYLLGNIVYYAVKSNYQEVNHGFKHSYIQLVETFEAEKDKLKTQDIIEIGKWAIEYVNALPIKIPPTEQTEPATKPLIENRQGSIDTTKPEVDLTSERQPDWLEKYNSINCKKNRQEVVDFAKKFEVKICSQTEKSIGEKHFGQQVPTIFEIDDYVGRCWAIEIEGTDQLSKQFHIVMNKKPLVFTKNIIDYYRLFSDSDIEITELSNELYDLDNFKLISPAVFKDLGNGDLEIVKKGVIRFPTKGQN